MSAGSARRSRSRATPEPSPASSRPPAAGVEASLRRALTVARRDSAAWDAAAASCEAPLASLANRAEQLRCLRDLDLDATPLRDFPDLGPRLGYKISQAMEELLARVEEQMKVLQELRDRLSGELGTCWAAYEREAPPLAACLQRAALRPSLADMLAWLQDVEHARRLDFMKRRLLLQRVGEQDLCCIQGLPQAWAGVSCKRDGDFIHDVLLNVSFFVDEN